MFRYKIILLLYLVKKTIPSIINSNKVSSDAGLNIFELIEKYGYPHERHENVITDDGYILELHRIPHGKKNQSTLGPVLLMHGLLSSSADWCSGGINKSLAYLLADAGYDVWMGNARGNTWSRKHIFLNPDVDKPGFWNFSWHEIGVYDLPANIDYILNRTGANKLQYIGHSQGTTAFWVLLSTKPQYGNKIKLMNALAPVAFTKNLKNPIFRFLASFEYLFELLAKEIGLYEILPRSKTIEAFGREFCYDGSSFQRFCATVIFLICGFDRDQMNSSLLPVISTNSPAGASTKQVLHYLQGIKYGYFRQYYYHSKKANMKHYGQPSPPEYDLSKVDVPVALHYSKNDWLSAIKDVEKLSALLPNVVLMHLIDFDKFNHLDFIWSIDIVDLLYKHVLEIMSHYDT